MRIVSRDGWAIGATGFDLEPWGVWRVPQSSTIWATDAERDTAGEPLFGFLAEIGAGLKTGGVTSDSRFVNLLAGRISREVEVPMTGPSAFSWSPLAGGTMTEPISLIGVKLRKPRKGLVTTITRFGYGLTGRQFSDAAVMSRCEPYAADWQKLNAIANRNGVFPASREDVLWGAGQFYPPYGQSLLQLQTPTGVISTAGNYTVLGAESLPGHEQTHEAGLLPVLTYATAGDTTVVVSVRGVLGRVGKVAAGQQAMKTFQVERALREGDQRGTQRDPVLEDQLAETDRLESTVAGFQMHPRLTDVSVLVVRKVGQSLSSEETIRDTERALADATGDTMEWRVPTGKTSQMILTTAMGSAHHKDRPGKQIVNLEWVSHNGAGERATYQVHTSEMPRLVPIAYGMLSGAPEALDLDSFVSGGAAVQSGVMAFIGDQGSGKTALTKFVAAAAVGAGHNVLMVNPKSSDDMTLWAEVFGGVVETVSKARGVLDPWLVTMQVADRMRAAKVSEREIDNMVAAASDRSATVLSAGVSMTSDERNALSAAMNRALTQKARCLGDVIRFMAEEGGNADLARRLRDFSESNGQLVIANSGDTQALRPNSAQLTVLQFGTDLDMPPAGAKRETWNDNQIRSFATLTAITQIGRLLVAGVGGERVGVVIISEAHVLTGSEQGAAILDSLTRTGRSSRTITILDTQRPADIAHLRKKSALSAVIALPIAESALRQEAVRVITETESNPAVEDTLTGKTTPRRGILWTPEGFRPVVIPAPPGYFRYFGTNIEEKTETHRILSGLPADISQVDFVREQLGVVR